MVEGGEPLSRDHEFKYHRTLDQYSSFKCLERHKNVWKDMKKSQMMAYIKYFAVFTSD